MGSQRVRHNWATEQEYTDAEKAFDKIQHPFMIKRKNSLERRHRRNVPQHNKAHIWQTANIILKEGKLKAFPLRIGTRQSSPLSSLLFNIVLEGLVIAIREEKEIKGIQMKK